MHPIIFLAAATTLAALHVCASAAGAEYRCGGIGVDEATQMKAEAANHDLMLTFAADTGAYVSDVDVNILDARGRAVVSGRCDGPLMLVDLPAAGNYRVSASFRGVRRAQTVQVNPGGGSVRTGFVWPAD